MVRAWRLMPVTHPDLPVLLVSAVFGQATYAVHLTDLVHVWSEQLDRRAICMRAFQENTPIDPSYDNEQMAVFLGKLAAAFDAARPDFAQTRVALGASDDKTNAGDLVLRITATLPGGLQPLCWPMQLHQQPAAAVASGLVLPLVHEQARCRRERAALVAALRDKDAAIAKLADKLEALGSGVESAFPSLLVGAAGSTALRPSSSGGGAGGAGGGSRRKWTRADVEQRVKGLAPFRETAFSKQFITDDDTAALDTEELDVLQLVRGVFGGGGLTLLHGAEDSPASTIPALPHLDDWWSGLGSGSALSLSPVASSPADGKDGGGTAKGEDSDADAEQRSDDSFQTSPQRPVPGSGANGAALEKGKKNRTEEQRSVSLSPKETAVPTRQKAGLGKIGRLGAIGQKANPAPALPKAEEKPPEDDDDDTASEADKNEPQTDRLPSKRIAQSPVKKKATDEAEIESTRAATPSKKKNKGGNDDDADDDDGPLQSKSSPLPLRAGRGLGKIGGKAAAKKHEVGHVGTGTEQEKPKATEQEPAPASKRAAILQQVVEKHAAPVRKKRKF